MSNPRAPEWWKQAVFYQIYPRSFYDANGDGIGDLNGVIAKLDYLQRLGIDAIWISPIYQSPMFDFGYDVSNYKKIDGDFGTMDDFKRLLVEAHKRDIKVVMDMIMNHTSHKHKWFLESKSSKTNPKRDWYIWRKASFVSPPNNWKSVFGGSGWEYDYKTKEYYYHSFLKQQPDLNWRNKDLQEAFFSDVKFWLELGVDGFRMDVLNFIIKDKHFRNNPSKFGLNLFQKHQFTRNRPKAYKIIDELRQLVDSYKDRMLVAEIYLPHPGNSSLVASYLGNGRNGVHLAFDFSLIFARWGAKTYATCIEQSNFHLPKKGWPTLVLSNHDLLRSINRLWFRSFREQRARIEAMLLLTLKGTPFLYYGEEIGMMNKRVPYALIKDPLGRRYWPFFAGRDKARTPMQWDDTEYAGFSTAKPWLPVNNDHKERNVELQQTQVNSLLNFYSSLIQTRKRSIALTMGNYELISTDKNVLIYRRMASSQNAVVVLNFSKEMQHIATPKCLLNRKAVVSTSPNYKLNACGNELVVQPFEASLFCYDEVVF